MFMSFLTFMKRISIFHHLFVVLFIIYLQFSLLFSENNGLTTAINSPSLLLLQLTTNINPIVLTSTTFNPSTVTGGPTRRPTRRLTSPSRSPTWQMTSPTTLPTAKSSSTTNPSQPTIYPSRKPSKNPSRPSYYPSLYPSIFPSITSSHTPTNFPTIVTFSPSSLQPSLVPSKIPTCLPSYNPSSNQPSSVPIFDAAANNYPAAPATSFSGSSALDIAIITTCAVILLIVGIFAAYRFSKKFSFRKGHKDSEVEFSEIYGGKGRTTVSLVDKGSAPHRLLFSSNNMDLNEAFL